MEASFLLTLNHDACVTMFFCIITMRCFSRGFADGDNNILQLLGLPFLLPCAAEPNPGHASLQVCTWACKVCCCAVPGIILPLIISAASNMAAARS